MRGAWIAAVAAIILAPGPQRRAPERLHPPGHVRCPPDKLTVYVGLVVAYARTPERLSMEIETDWESREKVDLRYPKGEDVTRWFLFRGELFRPEHWPQIEEKPGRLRKDVRAAAWVCQGGATPVIDWQPPQEVR